MSEIDLLSLWSKHAARLSVGALLELRQVALIKLEEAGLAPLIEGQDTRGSNFWHGLLARVHGVGISVDLTNSIHLLSACYGSNNAMAALAAAYTEASAETHIPIYQQVYQLRAKQWQELSIILDRVNLNLTHVFPALDAIREAFGSEHEEARSTLTEENLRPQRWMKERRQSSFPPPPLAPEPEEEEPEEDIPTARILDADIPNAKGMKLKEWMPVALAPSPSTLRNQLLMEFPWAIDAINKVIEAVAFGHDQWNSMFMTLPLLFVGDPGCGKTHFCQRVAQLVGVPYEMMAFAGLSDARALMGTSKAWTSSHMSFPVDLMNKSGIANPLIIVDEIEKAQRGSMQSNGGDVIAGLLNFFERENAQKFLDPFLGVSVNASYVSWLATANSFGELPKALLSRMVIIEFPNPDVRHFDAIISSLLTAYRARLEPEVIDYLRGRFAKGGISVRKLKRAVEAAVATTLVSTTNFVLN